MVKKQKRKRQAFNVFFAKNKTLAKDVSQLQ